MPLKDIRGQNRAIEILLSSVQQDRVAGAYLFLGHDSCGKRKTAIEFAKLLNCQSPKDDSCGVCSSCIKIEKLIHPDLFHISKADDKQKLSIDRIRSLQNSLSLKPFEAKYKIAIITDAQDMSEEAANALLKILEEPDAHTIFILTTQNSRTLPITIVSRCQVIRFKPLSKDEVDDILMKDFSIEEEEAKLLSAISGANIKKALKLKEEDTLSWKNNVIDEFSLYGDSIEGSGSGILNLKRDRLFEALDITLGFYRDILIYKFTEDKGLMINIDRIESIAELAKNMSAERIEGCISSIKKAKDLLEANVNTKLAIKQLQERLTV
ncbi:MAG: DNA polymerase III subunit delta' [Candidatus Omnitrophica bacterium]|nr:DNA polymerase III subunit delta' [Candidatus Omnitrophota bacterium]